MRRPKLFIILFLAGFAIIGSSAFLLTTGRVIGQSFFGRSYAEGELKDYVANVLKQEIHGARCQAVDTNKNGYVSCDYTIVSQPTVPRSLECAAWGIDGFLNRGCKTRLPGFPSQ
ncbi:MAG: hypothetical protein JOZ78_02245 [Chroococcidiopsidaceae cyanobacterium CP_BM_ER_R8_30]|nr:hypothetical protein [Chroococcidiopsidaceae cyanobacterium CP_BM_ER_R8_30]